MLKDSLRHEIVKVTDCVTDGECWYVRKDRVHMEKNHTEKFIRRATERRKYS